MRGGARLVSGPPPDPDSLRGNKGRADWTHLPAAGRQGDAPPWPLTRATTRERTLWAVEWARPQAIMWERNGQAVEVAVYVRTLAMAERRNAPTPMRTLLRQQMDSLGISLPAMLRLRWLIDAEPTVRAVPSAPPVDIRDRLRGAG
jgi:hypothetical protein